MKRSYYISILFFFLIYSVFVAKTYSEPLPMPENESSPVFINAAKDDDNVQLFLAGNWEINLLGGIGFGWTPENGIDTDLCYSGITTGVNFNQSADITISLMIIKRILFEAAFTDDIDESSFMIGYRGNEKDFLQKINVGNMGLNLSENTKPTTYFDVPAGSNSSFGLYSLMSGPFSEHQLLIRFDPQGELTKLYIGKDYVVEYEFEPQDYIRGQLFYIPSLPSDVEFYFECDKTKADISEKQTNRHFYKAEPKDYSYSSANGQLYLSEPTKGAILARSESTNWDNVTSNAKTVDTDTGELLLIYDPGYFSGFEAASAYNLNTEIPNDNYKTRAFLAKNTKSIENGIELSIKTVSEDGIIIINPSTGGSNYFPLSGLIENPEKVYGPENSSIKDSSLKKIIVQIRKEIDNYTVEKPIQGSIKVYINGIQTNNWEEDAGIITFNQNINDSDRIEIVYKSNSSEESTNSLLLASTNKFHISENWTATIDLAGNLSFGALYSKPGNEFLSYGTISSTVRYDNSLDKIQTDNKNIAINGGISTGLKIYTENATGNLLLKNMSDNQLEININPTNILPSSFSEILKQKIGIKKEERGILYYKEYRTTSGFSGYTLQPYDYPSLGADSVFSPQYSTSENMFPSGPYIVSPSASDNRSSTLLAMDYKLEKNENWVGVQLPLSSSENLDLSGYKSVSFDWKSEGDVSNIDFYFEIGSIGEDLDGDGELDAEVNKFGSGFVFNDPNSDAGTLLGGDNLTGNNGCKDSEDYNNNGFVDTEKPEAVVFFKITDSQKPNSDWKRVTLLFSNLSSTFETSRKRLKNAEFIRITAVNRGTTKQSGRVLFDDFKIDGTSMCKTDEIGFSDIDFTEKNEKLIPDSYAPANRLSSITLEENEDNIVLDVEWNKERWKLFSYVQPQSIDSYNSIILFIHTPVLSFTSEKPKFFINLIDSSGKGIKASFPLEKSTSWQKIEIITGLSQEGAAKVMIDDKVTTGGIVKVDNEAKDVNILEFGTENSENGKMYIDEVFLSSPKLRVAGGVASDFSIITSKPLFSTSGIDIIGPINFSYNSSANYNENDDLFSGEGSYTISSKLSSKIFFVPISFTLNLLYNKELKISAGHDFNIPILTNLFNISDTFFISELTDGDFSKTNNLKIDTFFLKGIIAGFSASQNSNQLERNWKSDLNIKINPFYLNISANFKLIDQQHIIERSEYFTAWFNTTILMADFSEEKIIQRKISLNISPQLKIKPVAVETKVTLESNVNNNNVSTNTFSSLLNFPIKIDTIIDGITAELSYERFGDFVTDTTSNNFANDTSKLFSTIGNRYYLFTSIPFYELFNKKLPSEFLDDCNNANINTANFNNTFGFKLSRNYSSRLIDLILPYSLDFQLGRETKKDNYDIEDQLNLNFTWKSSALNLFGSAGAYSIFDFYFSDEINWSFETAITEPFTDNSAQEYLVDGGMSFFGHNKDIFNIDASFYIPINKDDEVFSIQGDIGYIWDQYPKEPFDIPLFSPKDEKTQKFTHQEKISAVYNSTFSTELKHTTSFILPKHLTISVFGLFGYEYCNESSENISLFGFSLGITGSIMY